MPAAMPAVHRETEEQLAKLLDVAMTAYELKHGGRLPDLPDLRLPVNSAVRYFRYEGDG